MMVQGHTLDDAEGVGHLRGPGVDGGQEHEEVVGRRVGHELQVVGLGPGVPKRNRWSIRRCTLPNKFAGEGPPLRRLGCIIIREILGQNSMFLCISHKIGDCIIEGASHRGTGGIRSKRHVELKCLYHW